MRVVSRRRFVTSSSTLVPLAVACALFIESMNAAVIATALPQIARDLGEDPVALKLALTAYLFSAAVFIPISGWAADRFGARNVFRVAIIIFTLASVACGFAGSLYELVIARIAQGVGGALMMPVGRLIIFRVVPRNELVGALVWLSIPAQVGPIIGPLLGGVITTYISWHWIFWINAPVGILGIVLATVYIPDLKEAQTNQLDCVGAILLGLGFAGLVFGFSTAGQGLLSPLIVIALLAAGATSLLSYIRHARRATHPILDLDLLRLHTFRAGVVGGSLFRISVGAVPLLLPMMLQVGFGLSPAQSGMFTCVAAIGAIATRPMAGPLLHKLGFRTALLTTAVISLLSFALYTIFDPLASPIFIVGVLLISGCFRTLFFASLAAITVADVNSTELSRATSLSSVAQQLSLSMGVAVAAFALDLSRSWGHEMTISPSDFALSILVVTVISATSLAYFAKLPSNAGEEILRRRIASQEEVVPGGRCKK